jgi:hypothetical protein
MWPRMDWTYISLVSCYEIFNKSSLAVFVRGVGNFKVRVSSMMVGIIKSTYVLLWIFGLNDCLCILHSLRLPNQVVLKAGIGSVGIYHWWDHTVLILEFGTYRCWSTLGIVCSLAPWCGSLLMTLQYVRVVLTGVTLGNVCNLFI